MNKMPNFREMDDEKLQRIFRLYQGLSGMQADNGRSLYHRFLYRAYGEIERRRGKVKDEKGWNLRAG